MQSPRAFPKTNNTSNQTIARNETHDECSADFGCQEP